MPKISIIVPIYNVEAYLDRCVQSILEQTFKDFELILVDDGSTDNCPAMCDEYAKIDNRIRVIHKKNGGQAEARNMGIDIAKGEYLHFVDSDDLIHPQMLEILYDGIQRYNVLCSICGYEENVTFEEFRTINGYEFTKMYGMDFYSNDKTNTNAVVPWGKLYHRSLFEGVRYPIVRACEDEFITYKILFKAGEISYCNEKLYKYYINNCGTMRREYNANRLVALDALEERNQLLKEKKLRQYYQWSVRQLLYVYKKHYIFTKEKPELKMAHKRIKHKMRTLLLTEGIKTGCDIKHNADCYETAFPRFMKYYWLYDIAKSRIKEKGFLFAVKRSINYIIGKLN